MKKKFLLLFSFYVCIAQAQDIHFSQFYNSPQNLNPALAGVFNGDLRVAANHKNQWRTLPVPYRTYSISADAKLPLNLKRDFICAGIVFNNDKSGDGAFFTNQAGISLSYLKKLNADSTSFLSLGLQPSLISKGFNLSKLTFDNQFSDGTYTSDIANGENFTTTKIQYFDIVAGLNFLQKIGTHSSATIGFSYSHFQKQNISFLSDNSVTNNPKYLAHATFVLGFSDKFELIPVGLYQLQNKNKEIVTGALARFIFESRPDKTRAFSLGAFVRLRDAFIVDAQLDYNRFRFGLSYDINTSNLKKASNGLGGFELSLIYIMRRFVKVNANKIICPVYL